MTQREITLVLTTSVPTRELGSELLTEIARDAAAEIMRRHSRLGYNRVHLDPPLETIRYGTHEWETERYPGESPQWAVTPEEIQGRELEDVEVYDDGDDLDF